MIRFTTLSSKNRSALSKMSFSRVLYIIKKSLPGVKTPGHFANQDGRRRPMVITEQLSFTSGMGNFLSQRAICGKTKSFSGRIIRWIEFNMFNNYYCQGRSDWKAKNVLHTPQMSCFLPKISVKQWRSEKLHKGGP